MPIILSAWREHGEKDRHVCLRSTMRLNIGVRSVEELLHTIYCQALDYVHMLVAAVVALAWQPFCILVGANRTLCLEHRFTDKIFASNELNSVLLSLELELDLFEDFRIGIPETAHTHLLTKM